MAFKARRTLYNTNGSSDDFDRYEKEFAHEMRQKGLEKFGTKALAFRTTMRVMAQGSLRDQ